MQALNLYDTISIKGIRSLLAGKVIDTSPQEMRLQYGDNSYLFVYRFGCLAFFNMSNEEIERETAKLKAALGPGVPLPTTETYQINVGDFPNRVEFEYVELKKLSMDNLRLIAMTVAQSAALEYFEISAERMLYDTSNFMQNLAKLGAVPLYSKRLVKIIGSTASTRQHIISNLSILDPPEETWKSKDLEKLYKELQQNFDIDIRFRTLDRKLTLIQDNIEILADLTSSRRTTILEALVVLLIFLEIALAILHKA
jgi:required for meiotic nuclear division protein 1